MRYFLHIAMVFCILQAFIIDSRTNMPAYVDPQYGMDGRALQPYSAPRGFTVYDPIVRPGHSQDIWLVQPQRDGTATVQRMIIDDDDSDD